MHRSTGKGSSKSVKLGNLRIERFVEKLDIYGQSLPAFNIKGAAVVHTFCGGVFSMIIYVIALSYGALKMMHLLDKHNPNVTVVNDKNVYDFND